MCSSSAIAMSQAPRLEAEARASVQLEEIIWGGLIPSLPKMEAMFEGEMWINIHVAWFSLSTNALLPHRRPSCYSTSCGCEAGYLHGPSDGAPPDELWEGHGFSRGESCAAEYIFISCASTIASLN